MSNLPLESALLDLVEILNEQQVPYMVIGGLAVIASGVPRSTIDIDVTIWAEESDLAGLIKALRLRFEFDIDRAQGDIERNRLLQLKSADGVDVDLSFAMLPFELEAIERSVEIPVQDGIVKFCSAEDVIIHKIISERPKDQDDVEGIVRRNRDTLDLEYLEPRIRQLSEFLENPSILANWEKLIAD